MFLNISQILQENTWRPATLFKETPTQVCEIWESFKNTYLEEHRWTTASEEHFELLVIHTIFVYLLSGSIKAVYTFRQFVIVNMNQIFC